MWRVGAGTQDPMWWVLRAGGAPVPFPVWKDFLVSGAAIECAVCQVACFTGYTELICNPLYKLYLQITVVIFPYTTKQVVHGLGEP